MTSKAYENATDANRQQGGRRNLIINGAMQVAQRGTSFSSIASGDYNLDRFKISAANSTGSFGTWTASQDSDAPDGFASSLKMDCTATSTIVPLTFLRVEQRIEGQNLQQLKKGSASAEPLTLSFWVKSAKSGVHTAELFDSDNNRNFSQQYTVDSAGTWEYKTITYTGDTTGALDNDNNGSFYVAFWLLAGSSYDTGTQSTGWAVASNRANAQVDLGDSASNYWQITGVQLEVGDTATPFEHRSYGEELALCQRYYQVLASVSDNPASGICYACAYSANALFGFVKYVVEMRASPSIDTTATEFRANLGSYNGNSSNAPSISNASLKSCRYEQDGFTGLAQDVSGIIRLNSGSGQVALDAEL